MFESVYITSVVVLVLFIGYSSQTFLYTNDINVIYLLPLNYFIVMLFYNYYLAVTTDPGRVPNDWEPPASIVIAKEITAEGMTGPRFCKSCNVYKPPRSHHCKYCKRCVLKMDHHCPWINNCVGYYNYGHFLRFIIYASIACLYILVLLIERIRIIMQFDIEPIQIALVVINFSLALCVLFSVGILSLYQIYCLCRNQSTIEAWERSRVETLVARGKIPYVKYPFDMGTMYGNICQVLGSNPILWLWPQEMQGDGLTFPILSGTDPKLPYFWPIRDPDDLRPSIFSTKYKRQHMLYPNAMIEEEEDYYDSGSDDDIEQGNIPLMNLTK